MYAQALYGPGQPSRKRAKGADPQFKLGACHMELRVLRKLRLEGLSVPRAHTELATSQPDRVQLGLAVG